MKEVVVAKGGKKRVAVTAQRASPLTEPNEPNEP